MNSHGHVFWPSISIKSVIYWTHFYKPSVFCSVQTNWCWCRIDPSLHVGYGYALITSVDLKCPTCYIIFSGGRVGFNWIIQSDHFAIIGAFVMSNRGDNNNRITNSLSVQLHLSISFELYWKPCCNDWMSCSGQQRQLLATLIHCHRECFPKKVQILPFVVRQRSLH